jgi:putative nucleotidyltransferase with HDIG domain
MSDLTRLAEALGGLSLAVDAANGFPQEKVLRTTLLAASIGAAVGLPPADLRRAWWTPLVRYLGCTAFAGEEASRYGAGDDNAVRNTMVLADEGDLPRTLGRIVRGFAPTARVVDKAAGIARILGDGRSFREHAAAQCEGAGWIGRIAGAPGEVVVLMDHICERWDGRGQPRGLRGDEVDVAVRLYRLADVAEVAWHRGGVDAAVAEVRRRAGQQLDPDLCAAFLADAPAHAAAMGPGSVWERFLASEPRPWREVGPDAVDDVCLAFAHVVDLKSMFTVGHSVGVARLAERAARALGLDADQRRTLRRAALLHDLGRLAVPNTVWDKPGPLGFAERELAHSHAWRTERLLHTTPLLRPLAALAAAAHERCDGSGYHRGLPRGLLPPAARLLAAADARHAMGEPRPHRPALSEADARRALAEDVAQGRLDAEAVRAVLMAAGEPDDLPAANPGGLSDREVEVLVLVARGASNKEIAARLGLSAKTVQHHVAHVYDKIGVRSRAAAALFAVERGLL